MIFFKKSSFRKLIVAIFTFSLYAYIAKAGGGDDGGGGGGGSGAALATIIFAVVLVVIAITNPAFLFVASGTPFWAAPVAYITGAVATVALGGVAVGGVQCLMGQDSVFFTGCEPSTGSWGGQQAAAGSPILLNESYTATCDSVSLTYDISGANQYGIYRTVAGETNSSLITQGSASSLSKIIYTDTAVVKQTTYQYVLVATDNGGQQFQYPPINAYTKCLSECAFGADKSQVVFPETATLSWTCSYADSCSISPTVGSVNAQSGSVVVSPASTTDYILTCQNADGPISFSSSLNVINPKIKEVKP